jgi:hypothetical protein
MPWEMADKDVHGATPNTEAWLTHRVGHAWRGGGIGDHRLTLYGALAYAQSRCVGRPVDELIHICHTCPISYNWGLLRI